MTSHDLKFGHAPDYGISEVEFVPFDREIKAVWVFMVIVLKGFSNEEYIPEKSVS
tara:strand:+ start:1041 stop:1205 length:165 start_codon:yes stop_codon:yes gene_type:complete